MVDGDNKYSRMQKSQYDQLASVWRTDDRDPVVGSFDQHNAWSDYDEFLFKNVNTTGKLALDFGCGPGRNIVKFNGRFKQMDGVDISDVNLANAKLWCKTNDVEVPVLYRNNGADLSAIGSEHYDVVLSTICMQ